MTGLWGRCHWTPLPIRPQLPSAMHASGFLIAIPSEIFSGHRSKPRVQQGSPEEPE